MLHSHTFARRLLHPVLLSAGLIFGVVTSAAAIPLANGESIRVRFDLPAPPNSPIPGLPASNSLNFADVLLGFVNATRISGTGAPAVHIDLYNGSMLLGGFDLTFAVPSSTFAFAGPNSIYDFHSSQVSDIAALEAGTLDGLLEITSISNAIFDYSVSDLQIGHTTAVSGFHRLTPDPVITFQGLLSDDPRSTTTAVSEPNSLLLFCLGIAMLGVVQIGRRIIDAGPEVKEPPEALA